MKESNLMRCIRQTFLTLIGILGLAFACAAQTRDLTVDVLINSTNTTGYNTSSSSPGEFQRYPERYLEHLQVPYRLIDVSNTAPPDLSTVQLIIAGQRGLQLSSAWQQAIINAVQAGTGFVNLDFDTNIGFTSHMQTLFGSTGSVAGTPGTSITLPAAFLPDGSTPHYIMGLQIRFPSTPAGDIVYAFHSDDNDVTGTATATVLQGASGTVLAKIGSDPLLTVKTFGSGRAVYFGTYDYLKADRFGFVMGLDDLFWRSLVWAARKPFVLRGYPRFFAVQQDDNVAGWGFRVGDMYDPTLTGNLQADGTGGPWKPTGYIQIDNLDPGSSERQQVISDINAGKLKVAPHTVTGGSGGDFYWTGETSSQLTDSQWLAHLNSALSYQTGEGGSDVLPFSSSLVPHFWDLSNNTGYDLWHSLGVRYITEVQKPGVYYSQSPAKGAAQRLALRPFRIYELPPTYGDPSERWPIYYADDYTVGSRQGFPSQTFFAFCTQLLGFTYPRFDAAWPEGDAFITLATSVENWKAYAWRFWSSMAPAQIYTHDGGNMANSTDQDRQAMISQVSSFMNGRGVRHTFMEQMGAYMRARTKSVLASGQVTPSIITLNFTGSATDANGQTVGTKALVFYGDNDGALVDVAGFTNGTSISFPNSTPPGLATDKNSLTFAALPGGANPPSQTIQISNSGAGILNWTASDSATWLTMSPTSGTNSGTITASVNIAGLAQGTYNANINLVAVGATGSPRSIPVTLVIASPQLSVTPTSLVFTGFQGQGNPTAAQLNIANVGGGAINWTASTGASWLGLSATSGTAPSVITAQPNISGLAIGSYNTSIVVTAPGANSSPQTIPVTLNIAGLLMSSDFSDGTINGWAFSPLGRAQNWSVASGALQYNGGGHTQLYAGDANWSDYDVQADIKLASLSDYPGGIRGRINPSTGASYTVWLYPNERIIRLYRTVGWNIDSGFTQLGQASGIAYDASSFHQVKLSFSGSTIRVFFDGASVISATDTTLTSGMVALDVSNQPITFDNVFVSGLSAVLDSIAASPSSLSFSSNAGSTPAAQTVQISSSGGTLAWSASSNASWLSVSTNSGVTPASLNVSVNTSGLATGNYNGVVTVYSRGAQNGSVSTSVSLAVSNLTASIVATPASLNFFGATTQNPPVQNLTITNGGSGTMSWSTSSNAGWLTTGLSSGTAPATTTVTASSVGMAKGQYTGAISISSSTAGNSPLSVPVSLQVGDLLFSDDFSAGAGNWQISPLGLGANWSVTNGAYTYNGGGATQSYSGSSTWTDYSFSVDFKLSSLSNYPGGIRARVNLTTGAGYAVWFYPGSGLIRLYRVGQWNIDSGFATLGQAPLTFDATTTHNVRFDMQGSTIRVFYDNVQVIQVTDTTYTSGGVAFDVSNQPIQYDNVRVISF